MPPDVEYEWDFGLNAVPPTASGIGPHVVQYTTSGVKTVTCTATSVSQNTETVETTNITVSVCLGNIVGSIEDLSGNPLQSYNMRLYPDADQDGIADGAVVRSVFSTALGQWSMASLTPGWYILEQANGSTVSTVSILDDGTHNPPADILPSATPTSHPNSMAVRIQIKPSQLQGVINIIMNI